MHCIVFVRIWLWSVKFSKASLVFFLITGTANAILLNPNYLTFLIAEKSLKCP